MADTRDEAMEAATRIVANLNRDGIFRFGALTPATDADTVARALLSTSTRLAHLEASVRDLSFQHTLDQERLQDAWQAGYAEGVEAAAKVADDEAAAADERYGRSADVEQQDRDAARSRTASRIAETIRSLSVPSGEGDELAREDASGRTAAIRSAT